MGSGGESGFVSSTEEQFESGEGRMNNAIIVSEELRDSEIRYRRLFEAAQDGILILDARTGVIVDANPFLAELIGYSHKELMGKTIWDIGLYKDVEASKSAFRELKEDKYVRYENLPLRTREGPAISVEVVSNVYLVNGHRVIQCNIRDTRIRKNAERSDQKLIQAQKMEAVGQLAGGLAHDFNNILGVILGYCEILEGQGDLPTPTRKMINEIHNAGTSAKTLTQRLLAFSRRQVMEPTVLDLNEIIERVETMLNRLIGDDVELVSELDSNLGAIHADPGQIEQLLMNLAINARDAMPIGGKIIVKTANVEIDDAFARQHPSSPDLGQYVMMSVCDTGIGMDAETQSHIFEPFFTTKPLGQGTGLGLSTVFGIVRQSGGTITVYSEPEKGATFRIYFPRCDETPDDLPPESGKAIRGGTETILLVDDSEALRQLTRRLLEDCGYTLLDSGDPIEALRIAIEYQGPLPLMITDVIMPGFSGSVLAEKLAAFRPETRVLYASGYTDHSLGQRGVRGKDYAFLEKPFTRNELLKKVRELLDAPVVPPGKSKISTGSLPIQTH
jgi:PAS domain S-box-containing protein